MSAKMKKCEFEKTEFLLKLLKVIKPLSLDEFIKIHPNGILHLKTVREQNENIRFVFCEIKSEHLSQNPDSYLHFFLSAILHQI